MLVAGLTPQMTIGRHGSHLYFGMNNEYRIQMLDLEGKQKVPHTLFSLDREQEKISKQRKHEIFKNSKLPPQALSQIVKSLPNSICHFQGIEVHNGMIYILGSDVGKHRNQQAIDIFSLEGKYLYRATVRFRENRTMLFSPFGNFRIVKDNLYVALENQDGEVMVARFKISQP